MQLPPALVIHGLADARLALAPGQPVALLSAPGAALYAGCGWWRAVIAAAMAEFPDHVCCDILDAADAPGRAMEALWAGCRLVVLAPGVPAFADIAARAETIGARLLPARPQALDLATPGALRRIEAWLATRPRDSGATFG